MVDFVSFFQYQSTKMPILGDLRVWEGQVESLSPERRANKIFQEMYRIDWDKLSVGENRLD